MHIVYIYIYIHTYMCIYIYIYTHTCIQIYTHESDNCICSAVSSAHITAPQLKCTPGVHLSAIKRTCSAFELSIWYYYYGLISIITTITIIINIIIYYYTMLFVIINIIVVVVVWLLLVLLLSREAGAARSWPSDSPWPSGDNTNNDN